MQQTWGYSPSYFARRKKIYEKNRAKVEEDLPFLVVAIAKVIAEAAPVRVILQLARAVPLCLSRPATGVFAPSPARWSLALRLRRPHAQGLFSPALAFVITIRVLSSPMRVRRTKLLQIRVSAEEREMLKALARIAGKTPSAWVRELLLSEWSKRR